MKLPRLLHSAFRVGDPSDPWGRIMAWRFALADYLTSVRGQAVPGFNPSPLGPDTHAPEFQDLRRGRWALSTLTHFGRCLERLESIHRAAGRNY